MENEDEKLYRVKTKEGAHINKKVKEDGSRSAIQFDEENGLQGPVDLVEVDESEYTREVYIESEDKERSVGEIILEDIIAPAAVTIITELGERAIDAGIDAFFNKVIPAAKTKGSELISKAKNTHSGKNRSEKKPVGLKNTSIATQNKGQQGTNEPKPVYHSQEDVEQIINNMRFAALYIAAAIRELSNTVVVDTGDPTKAIEIENRLKELSSEEVVNTINFMLEDGNRDKLDQATIVLFEEFRNQNLIVNGETVPISKYFENQKEKEPLEAKE